jgi:hypothetical protein
MLAEGTSFAVVVSWRDAELVTPLAHRGVMLRTPTG